jgi:hypothetical protein
LGTTSIIHRIGYSLGGVHRQLRIEDGIWLSIVKLITFLVVQTTSQEVDSLMIEIDISERFKMNQYFTNSAE